MSTPDPLPGREALLAAALLRKPDWADPPEWWRGAMLYEVYIRSFYDTTGSGLGDLPGVIDKLDYIADLGVDGFWLTPFYPSPQKDFGYDITDLTGVDPQFGTLDDLKRLIEGAHDRDLRLLIDFVPGHTSDQHPWFRESRKDRENPKADWYLWADAGPDGGPPNNWLSSFGGTAWRWEPRRSQYVYHPFLTCQPALDLTNPEVMTAVTDAMRFWLDVGVDGFRLDAVQCLCCDPALRSNPPAMSEEENGMIGGGPHNPFRRQLHLFDRDVPQAMPVLEQLRQTVEGYSPERALIGELADVDSSRCSSRYTVQGQRLHAVYDFDLINGTDSVERWVDVLRARSQYMASGWTKNVFTNHDSVRAVSNLLPEAVEAGRAADGAKALLFLQATLLGGGIIFQGDELGLTQPDLSYEDIRDPWAKALWPDFVGRDGVRAPLPWLREAPHGGFTGAEEPWLPVPEEHLACAVDTQLRDNDSVLNFTRALLQWRRGEPLIRVGQETVHTKVPAPLVAFDRHSETDRMGFAVNLGLEPCELAIESQPAFAPISCDDVRTDGGSLRLPGLSFAAWRAGETSKAA